MAGHPSTDGKMAPIQHKPVICLGCAFWDTIFKIDKLPHSGTKVLPETAIQVAAGMATAAAATIARLGGPVELWARVGDDPAGDSFLRDLSRENVGIDRVRRVSGAHTAFSTILVDRSGERLVVPYTDPSLDKDPGWLPLHEVAHASAVLVDMRWPEGARAVLAEARRCGIPTVVDADIAPPETLRELIVLGDHVLFSEPALLALTDSITPKDALLEIAEHIDAEIVGVTLGAQGALIRRRNDQPGLVTAFPAMPVQAVDTLGAGDVWHGTYVYGLVNGWGLFESVRMANAAAAMKCERFGGRLGAPSRSELLEWVYSCTSEEIDQSEMGP
jgi:sulfofructose kinase